MQNRLPRRQQIFSQTLEPVAKNRFTTLKRPCSNHEEEDELQVDETPVGSGLDSITDVNDSVHITDQSSLHNVSKNKGEQDSNAADPRQNFVN